VDGTNRTPADDGTGIELEYETVSESPAITRDEVGAVVRALLTIGDDGVDTGTPRSNIADDRRRPAAGGTPNASGSSASVRTSRNSSFPSAC